MLKSKAKINRLTDEYARKFAEEFLVCYQNYLIKNKDFFDNNQSSIRLNSLVSGVHWFLGEYFNLEAEKSDDFEKNLRTFYLIMSQLAQLFVHNCNGILKNHSELFEDFPKLELEVNYPPGIEEQIQEFAKTGVL